MTRSPYVVSGDIDILLARWAARHGFDLPQQDFFQHLQGALEEFLRMMFDDVEFIPSHELSRHSLASDSTTIVTLDKVYNRSPFNIELTRTATLDFKNGPIHPRTGNPDMKSQIETLIGRLNGVTKITLYDDVIFTGHLLETVCDELAGAGLQIEKVTCGVGIKDGVDRLRKKNLEVTSHREYESVIDQICERDFYPGVDYSGRTLQDDGTVGLPYLLPFGNPAAWASIPEKYAKTFSVFCLGQTLILFQEIERVSKKIVFCSHIDRKLTGLPPNGARFVDFLSRARAELL